MNRLHISIGVLSAAIIAFQLVLMHLLSIVQWHHFAYMVISVALLGFGASGTVIALARTWLLERFETVIPIFMLACGVSMAWVFALSQSAIVRFDSYLLFVDAVQVSFLFLSYLLFFIPFFFGALAIGLILIRHVDRIGTYYFANLIGSGLGGLIALVFLWQLEAEMLPAATGLISVSAGLLMMPRIRARIPVALGILALVLVHLALVNRAELTLSQYKSLSRTLSLPGARIETQSHGPHGLLQVVSAPSLRFAPGMSLSDPVDIPSQRAVFINGDWVGAATARTRSDTFHILDHTTSALPYVIRSRNSALILDAGTGDETAHALANGADRVSVVESNGQLVSLVLSELSDVTDSLYFQHEVDLFRRVPRAFLATDTSHYDIATIPTVGEFGGTIGLMAMKEQYLLTTQGLRAMWSRLNPNGALSVTVWMDYPYRYVLRVLSTLTSMLAEANIEDPTEHIAAVRSWGAVTIVVSPTKFTAQQIENVRAFSQRMSFDPLVLPGLASSERTTFNSVQDEQFFTLVDHILSKDRRSLFDDYDFDIRPTTDNRPYFAQFLKWDRLPQLLDQFGWQTVPFFEVGYLISGVTLLQILILSLLLIIIPLFRLGWRGPDKAWTFIYFGGLGTGYLFVEIVLIQRFTLYLGHPIYAAAAVLAAVLIFSGIGSLFSERLQANRRTVAKATVMVVPVLAVYVILLTPILTTSIALAAGWKILLALVLIAPPAFFMGIPFPVGLRFLSEKSESQVPWAWGINGCLSVVSTALAAILAVEFGFVAVMALAATAYGLVSVASLRLT